MKGEGFAGELPLNRGLFLLGKASIAITWIFITLQALSINLLFFKLPIVFSWIGTIFFSIGIIFALLSFYYLGSANKFGLPDEETTLITNGIYKISRNPMYVGFFLMTIASCIYCPNPINLIFGLIGISIHHKVVISEEEFLYKRFKDEWLRFKNKVRRYL
ncbi:MAG: methyltransferase family protein [Candidatus Helarchaeota archaeon]